MSCFLSAGREDLHNEYTQLIDNGVSDYDARIEVLNNEYKKLNDAFNGQREQLKLSKNQIKQVPPSNTKAIEEKYDAKIKELERSSTIPEATVPAAEGSNPKTNIDTAKNEGTGLTGIASFKTAQGSVYTVLPDGRTQRFKTATGETNEPQDLIVFVNFKDVAQEQRYLEAVQMSKESGKKVYLINEKGKVVNKNSDIKGRIALVIADKNGKAIETIEVSAEPEVGYNTYDQRRWKEGGEEYTQRHIGNEVTEIKYKNEGTTEGVKEGVSEGVNSSLDETVSAEETVEQEDTSKKEEDIKAEPLKTGEQINTEKTNILRTEVLGLDPILPNYRSKDNLIRDAIENHITRENEPELIREITLAKAAVEGSPMDASRQIAMGYAIHQLNIQRDDMLAKIKISQGTFWGNLGKGKIEQQREALNEIEDHLELLTRALIVAGSTAGRALGIRSKLFNFNRDTFAALKESLKDEIKNGVLDEEDMAFLKETEQKLKDAKDKSKAVVERDAKRSTNKAEIIARRESEVKTKSRRSFASALSELDKIIAGKKC